MENKKYLVDLTSEELGKIFDNNNEIRAQVYEQAADDAYYFIENEYIYHFRHHDGKKETRSACFEDDAYNNIFIKIQDAERFLDDASAAVNDLLSDENKTLLGRLRDKSALFTECEVAYIMSDARQERFEAWFRAGLETIKNALKKIIEAELDATTDPEYLKTFFCDEAYCKDDLYIIGDDLTTVYEDIVKTYK